MRTRTVLALALPIALLCGPAAVAGAGVVADRLAEPVVAAVEADGLGFAVSRVGSPARPAVWGACGGTILVDRESAPTPEHLAAAAEAAKEFAEATAPMRWTVEEADDVSALPGEHEIAVSWGGAAAIAGQPDVITAAAPVDGTPVALASARTAYRAHRGGRAVAVGTAIRIREDVTVDGVGPDGIGALSAVVLHEVAHAVGLAHVHDADSLMHATPTVRDYAPGDLAGLRDRAAAACARG
jgi:hypothetical protein